MAVATIAVAPLGIATGGGRLLEPGALATGLAVAMLSAAIPFTLELHALRIVGPACLRSDHEHQPGRRGDARLAAVLAEPLRSRKPWRSAASLLASAGTALAADVSR